MIGVSLLGATGSVGASTLDIIERHPDRYRVVGIAANDNVAHMVRLAERFRPLLAAMASETAARALRRELAQRGCKVEVRAGAAGLCDVARLSEAQVVLAAIVGSAGLAPTLAAVDAAKRVLLANKESLVMAGDLFMDRVRRSGAVLLPVDSEQNAMMQCLAQYRVGDDVSASGVERIWLTASGGPFLRTPVAALRDKTPAQACAHPTWSMGPKISVDSATMMNKGLEVIETARLFQLDAGRIEVVIHPQSVVHSLVEFVDGSLLAQLGSADMRVPLAWGLAWPERIESGARRLSLFDLGIAEFEPPDESRFPCLGLARKAERAAGTAPAILNAANEVAVQAFLDGVIPFTVIAQVVEQTLESVPHHPATELEQIYADDSAARVTAVGLVERSRVA
ncbi:MAG: 1-deoxy-D-xylulose-5-phosphate reductoisomerase [Pseudomonadota bacterium]|nr:1-deoxy-D-xylulose-5-phosphate reductoisomerase [Pseudomonadota bacterium]